MLVERPKHIGYTLPCPGGGGMLYENEFILEHLSYFLFMYFAKDFSLRKTKFI